MYNAALLFFVLWCFTGVKHLGTCDLSGLKPLYWLNQVTRIPTDPAKILRIFFSTKPTYVWQKKIFPSNFAFFDQLWSQMYPIWRLISKKNIRSIVANCLKISNLFSEVSFIDGELTSILWRENCTWISAFCSSGARTKADVTKCGHDLKSSCYALQNGI